MARELSVPKGHDKCSVWPKKCFGHWVPTPKLSRHRRGRISRLCKPLIEVGTAPGRDRTFLCI